MSGRLDWIEDELAALGRAGLRRQLRARDGAQSAVIRLDGQQLVNFGSNDYLGLAADPRIAGAAAGAAAREGWGSGASPLISGRATLHCQLEARLAKFENTEAALLFSSGFAANAGTIPAISGAGDVLFADAKNHASLIDGCRLSRAETQVYRHGDCDHLAALLREAAGARRRLVVTDSLFSMDGDFAPLVEIAEVCQRLDAMLMVDEAHATGVFGENGRGVAELLGVEQQVDVRVGTLSKALGCAGGFVAGSQDLISWLANRARPYVFSTAQPAATAAAASMAVRIVCDEPQRRLDLLERAAQLRASLASAGWDVGQSASQIIPIRLGDAERTMQIMADLAEKGYFVPGIRPPSVPEGESLLRLSLCYGHTPEMIEGLLIALGDAAI